MLTTIFDTEKVQQVRQLLDKAQRVVILTHMSPDGDAMGSSLGLYHFLKHGKEVHVVVPNKFPDFFNWMPEVEQVCVYEQSQKQADAWLEEADLVICSDFNEPKRIGSLGDKLLAVKAETQCPIILIDHHLYPSDIADVTLSEPQSPSASELVYRLLRQLGEIDLTCATCLYTGMMTDTGNFSFNSNHPEMYEIIGEMVKLGVDKDAIYNQVFNAYKADRMRLMGYCLYQKMRIFPERHVALIYLSRGELYRFNFQPGDAEGLVNLPLQIKDVYYSCFMREDKVNPTEVHLAKGSKTKIKISMRSQGDRPVNTFCQHIYNGGGHKNASGGEYYGPLKEAVQLFLDNYEKELKVDN